MDVKVPKEDEEIVFAQYFFDRLVHGDGSVITDANTGTLNMIAKNLYDRVDLNEKDQLCLKYIIMACNILYNRTDMTVLPIEDGFYDLLLEKYKKYDKNFQVGSAVVEFRNFIENDIDSAPIAEEPFYIMDSVERDEVHQGIYDEITKFYPLTLKDFGECPIEFISNPITKRTHNTEHNHPSLVGTLDKAKFVLNQDAINVGAFDDSNVKVLERDFFQEHIKKGIISANQEIEVVCELKYDGISVEADCSWEVESARTRGDTGIGAAADITPILKGYPFFNYENIGKSIGVKFEAIMTRADLEQFNRLRGREYKNCRTAIVGLFGASDAYLYRDLITLVPLAIDRDDVPEISNRMEEIEFMNRLFRSKGEPLRYCYFKGTVTEVLYLIKAFLDEAKLAREVLNFMFDGIVVSYLDENIRAKLGRQNYINKYSMAVKFDPLEKQTNFIGYTYEVGQHGQITPMIHYNPVEFLGTIHTKSTGSSLDRFRELGLKVGDYINVTYVNDVMPYVSKVECTHNRDNPNPVVEFPTHCPICGTVLEISDSGKSAYCPNNECPARSIKRMTNMLQKLNIKGFAEATIKLLHMDHFWQLMDTSEQDLINKIGEADGRNLYQALYSLDGIPDYRFLGALGFTSIAEKKWKDIMVHISISDLLMYHRSGSLDKGLIEAIPNLMGSVTLQTIVSQFNFFLPDIECFVNKVRYQETKGMDLSGKKQIRFTGIRNKQLSELLNTAGYDADDSGSVTKKTDILLVPYEGFSSSKTKKVSDTCLVVPIDEFMSNMSTYLGEEIK